MRKFTLDNEDLSLDLQKKERERAEKIKNMPFIQRLIATLFGAGGAAGLGYLANEANSRGVDLEDGRLIVTSDIPDELLLKAMEKNED